MTNLMEVNNYKDVLCNIVLELDVAEAFIRKIDTENWKKPSP